MTGRGIDQVLRHPSDPVLHEVYAATALDYVRLAEAANGPIPRRVDPSYIWGAALDEFKRMRPDARIVNLETAITRSDDYVAKGINYRMHPDNVACLHAAGIDCCELANNHILDWGQRGLLETLAALQHIHIKTAGAGRSRDQAGMPAVLNVAGNGRVLVFAFACTSSGAPRGWAASTAKPGVNLLTDVSEAGAASVADQIARVKQPGDQVIVAVHWGENWGYAVPDQHRRFAHALIDKAGVAVIHGHSSHHPKAIEIYRDRLILYGCGDFLNDYEGIRGYEQYRDDLVLMYFADIETAGRLAALELVPLQIRNFQLVRPSEQDVAWIQQTLDRESRKFGAAISRREHGRLALSWQSGV